MTLHKHLRKSIFLLETSTGITDHTQTYFERSLNKYNRYSRTEYLTLPISQKSPQVNQSYYLITASK